MNNGNNKDYVSIVYDLERSPKTKYPKQLVEYLINRFDLQKNLKLVEIGCGRGDFLTEFQNAGLKCMGIDRENSSVKLTT